MGGFFYEWTPCLLGGRLVTEFNSILAITFGDLQSAISKLDQPLDGILIALIQNIPRPGGETTREADSARYFELHPRDTITNAVKQILGCFSAEAPRDVALGASSPGKVGQNHHKFIATNPSDLIGGANGVANGFGKCSQNTVASFIAIAVVPLFEVVHVQFQNAERMPLP